MAEQDEGLGRYRELLSALFEHHLSDSLQRVDADLSAWRQGQLANLECHASIVRHVERTERWAQGLAEGLARAGPQEMGPILRHAVDLGVLSADEFETMTGRAASEVAPSQVFAEEPPSELPDKFATVLELLSLGPVLVHFDARAGGVDVPVHLAADPRVVLRFGYELSPPIPDLDVDAEGITGTLVFGGAPHRCVLPWAAVFAVVSDTEERSMVWPADIPSVLLEALKRGPLTAAAPADPSAPSPAPAPTRPSHLKLVD